MPQELIFQWPAFKDVVALAPKETSTPPPVGKMRVQPFCAFSVYGLIPLAWFNSETFRQDIANKFGGASHPRQLVFNVTPVVREIIRRDSKTNLVIETRYSQPEIPIWTSLGGWSAASANQSFNNPGFETLFIQL